MRAEGSGVDYMRSLIQLASKTDHMEMGPVPVRALHLLYTPLNNYRRTCKEGKHVKKGMSETRTSVGVYNY